jgi:hypothetical protein
MKQLVKNYRFTSLAVTIITLIAIPTAIAGKDSVISGAIVQAGMCVAGDYICLVKLYSIASLILVALCLLIDLALNKGFSNTPKEPLPKLPPEITTLLEIRKDGIVLRNYGMGLTEADAVSEWMQSYIKWKTGMVNALRTLDEGKAEWIDYLGNFVPTPMLYPHIINDHHLAFLQQFTETLERLEMILRIYLDLPPKPDSDYFGPSLHSST